MAESFTLSHQLSKFEDHDNPGAAKLNRNVDEIDRLLIPEGTTLPTLYQIGKLFILTADDERTIYKNTGTQDAPEWTKIIKVSLLALPGVAPMADEDGKISTDFLKTGAAGDIDSKSVGGNEATDLLLLDGSQAMTGDLDMGANEIKNLKAPTGPNSAARLADVEGLKRYEVRAASLVNVAIATGLENGDSAGGVTLATGDLFALLGQTDPKENGVYIVPASGAAARASFADTAAELENLLVSVKSGTNTGTKWIQTAKGFVLGVDPVTWIQDYGTAYSSGPGIDVTGTVISAKVGEGLDLVDDEIVPKFDGPSLIVGPDGMKVNGLSVVEGGRIKRTTDLATSGPTDVIFTTEKDNENDTVDVSGAPTLYTARTPGFHHVEASIKTKPGTDGTYRSLKLVLVETAEVLKEDDRSDYVGNYRARSCSVSVNVQLEAGQSVKAVFETDATDGGATIAEASLSGAYQGAGALAAAAAGVDLADVLLLKPYYDFHGLLPGTTIQESLYELPARDFTFLGSGVSESGSRGTYYHNGASVISVLGWNLGATYNKALITLPKMRGVSNNYIFLSDAAPSTNELPTKGLLLGIEGSSITIYKRSGGSYSVLGTKGNLSGSSVVYGLALYHDVVTHELVCWEIVDGQPFMAFDLSDSTLAGLVSAGFRLNPSSGNVTLIAGQLGIYAGN